MKQFNQVKLTLEVNGEVKVYWVGLGSDLEINQLKNVINEQMNNL